MTEYEPSEQEIAAAARAIYEERFIIPFERASAIEIDLSLSSARAALRAAARVRLTCGEQERPKEG